MISDKTKREILGRLDRSGVPDSRFPNKNGEYWALCPFHADTKPTNFSVNGETGMFKCLACGESGGWKKLAKHLGIDMRGKVKPQGCTMAMYADRKSLAPGLLAKWGVTDKIVRGKPEMHMPYYDEDRQIIGCKRRLALDKSGKGQRFMMSKTVGDGKPHLYGLWKLPKFKETFGWILLVEGESDCHAAWTHGIPCIGVPGANVWKTEWTSKFDGLDVVLWMEPDQGGTAFVKKVSADLPNLKVIQPGPKDIGDAHVQGFDVPGLVDKARAKATSARRALLLAEDAQAQKKEAELTELRQAAGEIDSAEGLAAEINAIFHSQESRASETNNWPLRRFC